MDTLGNLISNEGQYNVPIVKDRLLANDDNISIKTRELGHEAISCLASEVGSQPAVRLNDVLIGEYHRRQADCETRRRESCDDRLGRQAQAHGWAVARCEAEVHHKKFAARPQRSGEVTGVTDTIGEVVPLSRTGDSLKLEI